MYGRGQSNLSHDFNAYDSSGKIWHIGSSTFVPEAVADYASYRIPAIKGSDANDAAVDAPFRAVAPSGTSRYVMRERGASLALSYAVWEDRGPRQTRTTVTDTASALTEDVS